MIVTPEIEDYLASLTSEDPLLDQAAEEARGERLPVVGPTVGRFLETVVLAVDARRVLEIGTDNGYAALWLARSLPDDDGALFSIGRDPRRAAMARARLEAAGLDDRAHVIVGDAARMVHKVAGPFDVIFNAGDRRQYGPPLDRLVTLLRPGGMLVTGDVLRPSEIEARLAGSPERAANETDAVAAFNQLVADPRLVTSFLPVENGLALSVKRR